MSTLPNTLGRGLSILSLALITAGCNIDISELPTDTDDQPDTGDEPPIVVEQIDDLTLSARGNTQLDLSGVFEDPDNQTTDIDLSVDVEFESLLQAELDDNILTLSTPSGFGQSYVEVTATSEGESVSTRFIVTVTDAASGKARVILMAGQSNMVGYGRNDKLSLLAPELMDARDDVFAEAIIHPNKDLGALAPGYGQRNNAFGPELAFGHVLGDTLEEPVYLYKAAKGGTTLANADHWMPVSQGGNNGNLYDQMMTGFDAFLQDDLADRGIDYEIAGVVWFQGYNDTFGTEDEYEDNLRQFIAAVREDLDNPRLPFVIAQINDVRGDAGETVMAAQATVADEDPYADWIPTGDQRPYYHYGSDSYRVIGERLGQAFVPFLNRPGGRTDRYETERDTALTVPPESGVSANDMSEEITVELTADPSHGQVELGSDGQFTYTPDSDFVGQDRFQYQPVRWGVRGNPTWVTVQVRDTSDGLGFHFPMDGDLTETRAGLETDVLNDGNVSFVNDGKKDGALHFSGNGGVHYWWQYPIPDFLNLTTEDNFSVSLWVRSDNAQTGEQILLTNKYFYARNSGLTITTAGTEGSVKVWLGALDHDTHRSTHRTLTGTGSIDDGQWHHVAAVFDFTDERMRLYIDGNPAGETDLSDLDGDLNRYEASLGDGPFGGDGSSQGFIGSMDEVRFYNRALSHTDVAELAQ